VSGLRLHSKLKATTRTQETPAVAKTAGVRGRPRHPV